MFSLGHLLRLQLCLISYFIKNQPILKYMFLWHGSLESVIIKFTVVELFGIFHEYEVEFSILVLKLLLVDIHAGSALAANVCKKITGRLTSAIAKQEDVSVQLEALDIMADMLSR